MRPGKAAGKLLQTLAALLLASAAWADNVRGMAPDLLLQVLDSADPVPVGTEFEYLFNLSNTGTAPATEVTIAGFFSASLVPVPQGTPGWTCVVSTIANCTLQSGTLAPGASATQLRLRFLAPGSPQTVQMQATASAIETDLNPGNNTNILQTTSIVLANADLNLSVAPSAASAQVGTPISFTANVSNAGPGNAPNLQLNGTLGGQAVFSSFTVSSAWSCMHSSGAISCTYQAGAPAGTLNSGLSAPPVVVNAIAGPSTGTATINLSATSAANDPTPANAGASITVTPAFTPQVDMSLSKSVIGTQPIPRGIPFTFRLLARNEAASNQSATSVQINDPLPAGIALQSFSGSDWSCSGNVVCNYLGTLAPGQTAPPLDLVVVYNLAVPTSGTIINNVATVSAAEPDPASINNTAAASVNLRGSADVGVQLTGPTSVTINSSFTVDLVASNGGPDDAANVTASATIASGFTVGTVSGGAGWSCTAAGQTVSCSRTSLGIASSTAASVGLTAPGTAVPAGLSSTASIITTSFDGNPSNNAATLLTVVDAGNNTLSLTKDDTVDPVPRGGNFEYVLVVRNTGNLAQSGFILTDTLPAALSFQGFSGAGWTCFGASTPGAVVTCNNTGSLQPNASSTVRLQVRAENAGSVLNQAQVVSLQSSAPATASELTTILDGASLALVKRARAPSVALGSNAFFDIEVSNASTAPASELILIDDLPTGLDPVAAVGSGWNCSIAGVRVECRRPSIAAGATAAVAIEVRPAAAGSYTNTARLSFQESQATLSSSDSLQVQAPVNVADLALSKTASQAAVLPGAAFEYRLTVGNLGPVPATGVRVIDDLPSAVELLSASGSGWTCQGSPQLVCSLAGSLAVGAQSTVVLQVRARETASGSVLNRASVSANEPDTVPANNSDSVATSVLQAPPASADLQIEASAPASAEAGGQVELRALLRNLGPSAASQPLLRVQLGSGWRILSGSGGGFSCTPDAAGADCRRDTLGEREDAQLSLLAQVDAQEGQTLTAALTLSAVTPDPNPGDNSASLSIAVVAPPPPRGADLSLLKQASAASVAFGERFSYTLTVRNLGPASAEQVVLRDGLPASLRLVSAGGGGFSCSGSAIVECSRASLAAGQEALITLEVEAGSSRGTVRNEAEVSSATNDPQPANNRSAVDIEVRAPDEEAGEQRLVPAVGADALAGDAAGPTAALCSSASGNLASFCEALYRDAAAGRGGAVTEALRSVYPEEVLSQFNTLNQLSTTQFFNVDARMSELRGGGGGFSVSGLTMQRGAQSLPVGLLQGLLQDEEVQVGGPGDLVSPWGFFVNGTISRGDQSIRPTDREVMLDFDSVGITAGVDYRMSGRWVVGGALGYNRFDSKLTDLGSLETRGITFTGYSAWYLNDRVYWDNRVSIGRVDLDQVRRLRIQLTGFELDDRLSSSTDARQMTLATGFGYHWTSGPWTVTPNASLRYTRSRVSAFAESGSDFAVAFGDQSLSNYVLAAGLQVSRVFSLSNGVLVPSFDLTWNREGGHDDNEVEARFLAADIGDNFVVRGRKPDQSYGSVGIGLVYVMANGRQAYLQWRESIGVDGLSRSTVNLGARFEF